jgi:hypothetical protein
MIERLRELPDLAETYPTPHDHTRFGWGHDLRVQLTIALGRAVQAREGLHSIADLSAGNGAIGEALMPEWGTEASPGTVLFLGDIAPGYPITGPIEETVQQLDRIDLFVCSETLEHLDDPAQVLRDIRTRARWLLYSTPVHLDVAEVTDENPEHLWQWDVIGVLGLLADAGWMLEDHLLLHTEPPYTYMIGVAS